jgi:gliding motility-associated-like protein
MKKFYYLLVLTAFTLTAFAQNNKSATGNGWASSLKQEKGFIENKGQFEVRKHTGADKVKFAYNGGTHNYYFTNEGVIYELSQTQFRSRTDAETATRKAVKEKGFKSLREWQEFQATDKKNRFVENRELVSVEWLGANINAQLIPADENSFNHSYTFKRNGELVNENELKSYKKIIYRDLYPNIDVMYEFHEVIGVKYSLIVHPGGDVSKVKLKYSKNSFLNNGIITIPTKFGDIIDHKPLTFYEDNKNQIISSSYKLQNNIISFQLGSYDASRTIIIDPWTQTPSFATDWDCVWECETDAAGNVYIIGGVMPLQLLKYNPAGTLQWTYNTPYDSTMWLGTFATDAAGNSYVTNGSEAKIQKISTTGSLVWNNGSPGGIFTLTEFWNIAFNCDQTRLIIGGTGGSGFGGNPLPYIYDINMNTGNVVSSVQVTGGSAAFAGSPQEVRSITACGNSKYYYLTHDSIGYIHQNFSACSNGANFKTSNGIGFGYKCENYRRDNSGIMAIRYFNGFVYVHRGNQIQKRNFADASIVATANIPGGSYIVTNPPIGSTSSQVGNSGLEIDECGNVYVGSTNAVIKFDQNLNQLSSYPTSYNVYDISISTSGDIIASGSTGNSGSNSRTGYVQSIAASSCNKQELTCCDATVCPVGPYCHTDGPVTLTPVQTGGTWSGPGVNASGVFNPSIAGPGTHTIVYTLSCGSDSINITVNACANLNVCKESNGNLTVSNGTGPYTWQQWQDASSTPITNQTQCTACGYSWTFGQCLNGLQPATSCPTPAGYITFATGTTATPPGTWPIKVIDSQGNELIINNLSSVPDCNNNCPTITVTTSNVTNVLCNGGNNGSATTSASGGSGTYTYTWTPGNLTGSSQSNLSANTYTITATDQNGCTGTTTLTITQPSALTASITSTTPADCGQNNGSATVSASGGTPGYTYSWSPSGGNSSTGTALASGTYTVTVTDNNNCTTTATANITCNSTGCPTITVSTSNVTNVLCNGGNNGSATASASGGNGTYTYTWTPGNLTGATQSNLSANTYTITATDQDGCTGTTTVTITQPSVLSANISSTIPADCGSNNGSATVSVLGGTSAYTYNWPSGGNAATETGLSAGSHTVTITDANFCTTTATANISSNGGPTVNISSQTNLSCFGGNTGSATVNASGGAGPYSYSWSPSGGNSATASGLIAGTYTVSVTDASGCVSFANVTITQPDSLQVSANGSNASCLGNDGNASVSVFGGTAPYSYLWNNGSQSSANTNLEPGLYTVTVTDNNGCSATNSVTIGISTVGGGLLVSAIPDSITIMLGDSVQLSASGGITYSWSPATGLSCTTCPNPFASPTETTTYTVTATDQNGCTGTDTVRVIIDIQCGEVWVPNAFSPNGDGVNDCLKVYGNCIESMEFIIFSRWGERVYESADPKGCWDGSFRGSELNNAVFVYSLKAVIKTGETVRSKGNISLIR